MDHYMSNEEEIIYKETLGINQRFLVQRTIGDGASCKVKVGLDR